MDPRANRANFAHERLLYTRSMSTQLPGKSAVDPEVPERFDPKTMRGEVIHAEHLARYRWVSSIADGRCVLDAGCGTAYGSMLLAEAGASKVTGVDTASGILDAARSQMPAGVTLEEGDVMCLPYEDGQFGLIVCFEVIEHLDDPGRALDEFRRLLSPDGVLAVSSPNRDAYPPGNPHHVHEYTLAEFEHELSCRFSVVRVDRQHTWITSGVLDEETCGISDDEDLGTGVRLRKLTRDERDTALYAVALAGQTDLPVPTATFELAAPVELRKWDALWHEQNEVLAEQAALLSDQARMLERQAIQLSEQRQVLADDGVYKAGLVTEVTELRRQLGRTEAQLARMPALETQARELAQLNDELLSRQETFDELVLISERYTVLVGSTSWKLTRPLRSVVGAGRRLLH